MGVAKAVELGAGVICAASPERRRLLFQASPPAPDSRLIYSFRKRRRSKGAQLLIYGSTVFLVDALTTPRLSSASRRGELRLVQQELPHQPLPVEGEKTWPTRWRAAFLGVPISWSWPWATAAPSGVWKGFFECFSWGDGQLSRKSWASGGKSKPVTRAFNKRTYEFDYKTPETLPTVFGWHPRNGIKR